MRPYLIFGLFFLLTLKSINGQELMLKGTTCNFPVHDLMKMINYFGFQPNLGQVGNLDGEKLKDVLFFTRHSGIDLYVRRNGVSYVMRNYGLGLKKSTGMGEFENGTLKVEDENEKFERKLMNETMNWARIDLELVEGIISDSRIEYSEPLDGYTNYYLSHCPDGVLYVPSYRVVRIKEVYPGIDWVWRIGEDGLLHHEFEVRDVADISKIKIEVEWADVELSREGKRLKLLTPLGVIEDGEIYSYDEYGEVDVKYVIEDKKSITFDVRGEVRGKLVIDPPLARLWATYYGGSSLDEDISIITDSLGNIFLTGKTRSSDFPTQNLGGGAYYQGNYGGGYYDVFILKFTNSGIKQWATYYGGNEEDVASSIITTSFGNIFLTGYTYSANFPTYNPNGGSYYQGTKAGDADAFILKFTNNGIRLWATYYGGSSFDAGFSIATDGSGNIFLTGRTRSGSFPIQDPGGGTYYQENYGGVSDAFILKFTNNGVRLWATYYGGSDWDFGRSIITDSSGNIFLTGWTASSNFPTYDPGEGVYYQGNNSGSYDAFIVKLTNNGVRLWATYYGGSYMDYGFSIITDRSGNIFLTGYTESTNFPTYDPGGGAYYQGNNSGSYDAFILKFTNNGVRLWATYYGGSYVDYGFSIITDRSGNIFLTGYTESTNFPTYDPGGGAYYQGNNSGSYDAFILKFTNNGVILWSTYYGGSNNDVGNSITTDGQGNVFVTGMTSSANFPIQDLGGGAYYQGANAGYQDAFILKFQGEEVTVVEDVKIPKTITLYQNYPNPGV